MSKTEQSCKFCTVAIGSRCATPMLHREVRTRLRLECEQIVSQLLEREILMWGQYFLPLDVKNNPSHFDFEIRNGLYYYVTGVFCQNFHRQKNKKNVTGTPFVARVSWIKIVCFFSELTRSCRFTLPRECIFGMLLLFFRNQLKTRNASRVTFLCHSVFPEFDTASEKNTAHGCSTRN